MAKQKTKIEWLTARSRYYPALWPGLTYWSFPLWPEFGVDKRMVVHVWDHGFFSGFWDKEAWTELSWMAVSYFKAHLDNLEEVRSHGLAAGKTVVDLSRKFAAIAPNASHGEFIRYFEDLTVQYQDLVRTNAIYWHFTEERLMIEIAEALKEYAPDAVAEITGVMSLPTEPSYSQVEERKFDALVFLAREKGIDAASVKNVIADFVRDYFWFPYEYVGPDVWDAKTVEARVRDALSKKEAAHAERDVKKEQAACVAKFRLSDEARKLFSILQMVTLMQDDRKMFNSQVCASMDGVILKELANRYEVPFEHMRYADLEMLKRLPKFTDADRAILKQRTEFVVEIETEKGTRFLEGDEARKEVARLGVELFSAGSEEVKEIRGTIAQSGKVRGRVRVLRLASEGKAFVDGEILVAGMTTPDYVIHMKRAAAIVTDEGGITCHAAIVSRELKKPCIIGTKIATKVLKDGDEVEVDAEKGIVKILKRA